VSAQELATARRFLGRRQSVTPEARRRLAAQIAAGLAPKVPGVPPGLDEEAFLECLAAAKAARELRGGRTPSNTPSVSSPGRAGGVGWGCLARRDGLNAVEQPLSGGPSSGPSGPRAGFWIRLLAALIDGVILGAVQFGVVRGLGAARFAIPISVVVGMAYFTLLEGSARGQTLGKMAVGIRVISYADGGPIGYGRAFIRYVGRILSGAVILLGYLWMLWDRERQTWHDKLANAVVVPVAAYPLPA
jgi:uncharacterized RDD family membrane protein YckC